MTRFDTQQSWEAGWKRETRELAEIHNRLTRMVALQAATAEGRGVRDVRLGAYTYADLRLAVSVYPADPCPQTRKRIEELECTVLPLKDSELKGLLGMGTLKRRREAAPILLDEEVA